MLKFDDVGLKAQLEQTLEELGVDGDSIYYVANSLISTSLRGTDSHGINLFPHYVNAVKCGRINRRPEFDFSYNSPTTAVLNADHAFGHHSGACAMLRSIEMAKKYGMGSVAVNKSSHFGAAAYFGLMAARDNCLGFAFTNADALVKASNARESFFGTNPICFTAPLLDEEPFCLDMATSMVSWNKRNNYLREMRVMENGWAFDIHGKPTKDPQEAASLNPAGEYKGFGLGMMVDILTSILSGALISKDILPMYHSDLKVQRNIGHFFMAIDISGFTDVHNFKKRLQDMTLRVRSLSAVNEVNDVMIPGDPEKKCQIERLKSGIPVDDLKYKEFLEIDPRFEKCLKV